MPNKIKKTTLPPQTSINILAQNAGKSLLEAIENELKKSSLEVLNSLDEIKSPFKITDLSNPMPNQKTSNPKTKIKYQIIIEPYGYCIPNPNGNWGNEYVKFKFDLQEITHFPTFEEAKSCFDILLRLKKLGRKEQKIGTIHEEEIEIDY